MPFIESKSTMDSNLQIVNDIEVSCSAVVRRLGEIAWTGTIQPRNTQVVPIPWVLSTPTLTIVRGTTTYTSTEGGSIRPTYTLSTIFGPPQYKQTDTASTILREDNLKAYIGAGGKPDDTIARVRELVQEKARLGEEAK